MQPDSLSAGTARSTLMLCALPKKPHQGHKATCQGLHRQTGPPRCPKFSQFGVCHPSPSAGHTATGSFTTRCKFTFSSHLPRIQALQRLTVSSNSLHLRQEPVFPSFYLFFSSRSTSLPQNPLPKKDFHRLAPLLMMPTKQGSPTHQLHQ